jgi:hypothetical protein
MNTNHNTLYITLLALTTLSLVIFYEYMRILHPQVAFMDTLRFLTYFENSERGTASLLSTWYQGEHRGFSPQLVVYLNAKIFKFDVFGATLSSGAALAVTGMLLGLEQYRTMSEQGQRRVSLITFISLAALTFLTLFSLANWELYSVDVGVALFGRNLIFILYWIGLDRALETFNRPLALRWALLISSPVIVLVFALGWSYAFVLATIISACVARPADAEAKSFRRTLLITLVASQLVYVAGGYFLSTEGGNYAPSGKIASLGNAATGFFFMLSSVFIGTETITSLGVPVWMQFAVALALIGAVLWLGVSVVFSKYRIPLVPLALMIYAGSHMAAISYARGRFDPQLAMAPRYYMDLSLLFIAFFWTATLFIRGGNISHWKKNITVAGLIILVVLFLVGQGITLKDEWAKAPYRHDAFNRMRNVTLTGVTSAEEATLLQSNILVAKRGVDVQRAYGLGPFRDIGCATPIHISGWFDQDDNGWIGKEANMRIKNCGGDLRLNVFVPKSFSTKTVWVSIEGGPFFQTKLMPGQATSIDVPVQGKNAQYLNITVTVDATTKLSDLQPGSK